MNEQIVSKFTCGSSRMKVSIDGEIDRLLKRISRIDGIAGAIEWCERKRDEAKDGETAYHYHQLAEMWRSRLDS